MYTLGEGEDSDDLVERLSYKDASGNVVEPSEDVVAVIQRMAMQPSYDDFITNLNAYPAELGGNLIRNELASNPNTAMIYSNLNQNYNAINALDTELAGINQSTAETNLDQFISNISGITNKQVLFGLYDQFTAGLDPSQHEQFFNAMEAELGGIDLGASYMEFKDFAGGGGTFAIPDIEIDGAFRSLEEGFALPENIFEERAKISRDRDYHLHDELEQFLQEEGIRNSFKQIDKIYRDSTIYITQVPTYSGGFMAFGWGSHSPKARKTQIKKIQQRIKGLKLNTRYYSAKTHIASFKLPPYIQALKN